MNSDKYANEIETFLSSKHIDDSKDKAQTMLSYMELVLKRNETLNLTAITDIGEFVRKQILDSLMCVGYEETERSELIADVGTGAGFPGIPLAVAYPEKDFVLIDSLAKRTDFINEAVGKLGITNVKAIHMRAEDAGREPKLREHFDLALCRAVAKLPVLCEYCLPLVRPGGFLFAYKTAGATDEIGQSKQARLLLGAEEEVELRIPGEKERIPEAYEHIIMVMRKRRQTPESYPRKAGIPAKVPL